MEQTLVRPDSQRRYRTKDGYIYHVYHRQKRNQQIKFGTDLPYTESDLREWAYSQKEFHELFARWRALDFAPWQNPSFDRIDDYKGYTLDNLQLMTGAQNRAKGHRDAKAGVNTKLCKAVVAIEPGGQEHTFHSVRAAARITKVCRANIYKCLADPTKSAGGFKWRRP